MPLPGKVVDCADHVIGCVENIIKSRTDGDLSHEMRYCMDPSRRNRTAPIVIDPRKDNFQITYQYRYLQLQ